MIKNITPLQVSSFITSGVLSFSMTGNVVTKVTGHEVFTRNMTGGAVVTRNVE